ncbi:MAG: hypothetical protein ABJC09_06540, partial [Terriglobia bacterium]
EIRTTQKMLRALVNPVEAALLSAEDDDEPESEEERAAVQDVLPGLRCQSAGNRSPMVLLNERSEISNSHFAANLMFRMVWASSGSKL